VAPFASVAGDRAKIIGVNIVGMKRNNFNRESIDAVKDIFQEIFYNNDQSFDERMEFAKKTFQGKEIEDIIEFLESNKKRAFCMPNNELTINVQ